MHFPCGSPRTSPGAEHLIVTFAVYGTADLAHHGTGCCTSSSLLNLDSVVTNPSRTLAATDSSWNTLSTAPRRTAAPHRNLHCQCGFESILHRRQHRQSPEPSFLIVIGARSEKRVPRYVLSRYTVTITSSAVCACNVWSRARELVDEKPVESKGLIIAKMMAVLIAIGSLAVRTVAPAI